MNRAFEPASWGFSANYTNLGPAFKVLKQKQDYFQVPAIFNGEANFRIKTYKPNAADVWSGRSMDSSISAEESACPYRAE